jgi:hypothetical protein
MSRVNLVVPRSIDNGVDAPVVEALVINVALLDCSPCSTA